MDNKEFKTKALRTEPTFEQYLAAKDRLNQEGVGATLILTLAQIQGLLENLDDIKKFIFYGKPSGSLNNFLAVSLPKLKNEFPENTEEAELHGQSFVESPQKTRVLHGILGVATESGELLEALLKTDSKTVVDTVNIMEELSDSNWYQALLADVLGFDVDDANERVIEKLMKRFPDKFDESHAINRDLDVERKTLEGK